MAHGVDHAEEDVEVVREIIAFFRLHAAELRAKGLDVDEMVRNLERQIEEVLAAARHVRDLEAEDRHLTEKREHLRRDVDGLLPGIPPDLVDGMATMEYLKGAVERLAEQRRGRGKHPGN